MTRADTASHGPRSASVSIAVQPSAPCARVRVTSDQIRDLCQCLATIVKSALYNTRQRVEITVSCGWDLGLEFRVPCEGSRYMEYWKFVEKIDVEKNIF